MKKVMLFLSHRIFIVVLLLLIQIAAVVAVTLYFSTYFVFFYGLCTVISVIILLIMINDDKQKICYKFAWAIPILLIPIFGNLLYLFFGHNRLNRKQKRQIQALDAVLPSALSSGGVLDEILERDRVAANQSRYIQDCAKFQPYKNTSTEYLPSGEAMFERFKAELLGAERFIFLEYFIIKPGVMWDAILDILVEKVKQGVDVRLIYDDLGCAFTLSSKYRKSLKALGIKCQVFNPFIPVLSPAFNNRDHRKIAIIDGHTGFTGGVNLSDEYINAKKVHGHWKDTAILLRGDAVQSFTMMFLSMWGFLSGETEACEGFLPEPGRMGDIRESGYVQPFSNNVLSGEFISESIYLNLINKAERYVYINTPYLIINVEIVTALSIAAKSGVDVRIVTPHIGDSWYVHAVTRSYYKSLVEAGVKIYEYTPGFMHAKSFVVDDRFSVIGSVNLDYRSLYLHLECGVWLYDARCIRDMVRDYTETLKLCQPITLADCEAVSWTRKLGRMILRIFAPLM